MARHCVELKGRLRVGQGVERPLFAVLATPIRPQEELEGVDLLISAEGRHVWVYLPVAEAKKFANTLLEALI
jgi:hypothetical protein